MNQSTVVIDNALLKYKLQLTRPNNNQLKVLNNKPSKSVVTKEMEPASVDQLHLYHYPAPLMISKGGAASSRPVPLQRWKRGRRTTRPRVSRVA